MKNTNFKSQIKPHLANMKTILLAMLVSILSISQSIGRDKTPRQYRATRITGIAPTIDGNLDDPGWQLVKWEGGFVQYEPRNGAEPSHQTKFKVAFDDNNLYVAVRAFDSSPDSIVSRLTRRDTQDGDVLQVGLDSYHDKRTAFVFGVTAGGVKIDKIITDDGNGEDNSWDPNWWVSTGIDGEGWIAEMRIPLSQLRFDKRSEGIWGFQILRTLYRTGESSLWNHMPMGEPGLVRHFGTITGLDGLEPRTVFDVTPYAVTSFSSYPAQSGNPFLTGSDISTKFGVDAKIGITNNITLDLTVLPDFGQVETDPSEVNLSAYETFLNERRPFFTEGRNISSFSIGIGDGGLGNDNLFYSRRIGRRPAGSIPNQLNSFTDTPKFTRIVGAAKVTGRNDKGLSLSVIESVTAEEKAEIDINGQRSFETVEPLTNFLVGRVTQELGGGNTIIGAMFTSVNRKLNDNLEKQMHRAAYSGGIDLTQYFKNRSWQLNINAAMSHVQGTEAAIQRTQRSSARFFQRPDAEHVEFDPTRTSLSGTGGRLQIGNFGSGHWNFLAAIAWKSPGFEINDIGYMREADQLISVLWAGYRQWKPKGIYRSFNFGGNMYQARAFSGKLIANGANLNGSMQFSNFWSAWAGFESNFNITSMTHLRGGPSIKLPPVVSGWSGFSTNRRKKLFGQLSSNFNFGADNHQGLFTISPGITYKPADNINFSFTPSYMKRFEQLQWVRQANFNGNPRYIMGTIDQEVVRFSLRMNYTVLPDLTIQLWAQPFVASGQYKDFKYITNLRAQNFHDRFATYQPGQISLDNGTYRIDEDQNGTTDYSFGNPNFRLKEFLSNVVIRWEFRPGSSLFLVWSQNRGDFEQNGSIRFFDDIGGLFQNKGNDIFLVKLTYRIGVR